MEKPGLYSQLYKCVEKTMKHSFISLKRGNSFKMIKREEGFSLVELLITMVVFVLILAATSNTFIDLLKDFKKQSALSETNIEGAVGLETLQRDIASAGYGLPWNVDGAAWTDLTAAGSTYVEAVSDPQGAGEPPDPASFNDGSPASALPVPANTRRAPRALASGNNTGVDFSAVAVVGESSDYLVIKAINVATNVTSQKWTHLKAGDAKTGWTPQCENVNRDSSCNTDNAVKVIVINPGGASGSQRLLKVDAGKIFFKAYSATADLDPDTGSTDVYVLYGVSPGTDLRMPFNRADYFIEELNMPSTCAPNTGVLYKAVVNHSDGKLTKIPVLDCVADMQVVFRRDTNTDGIIDTESEDISTLDATTIRDQVKEVRVYILAHEGQRDAGYTYRSTDATLGDTQIRVGEAGIGGRIFDLGTNINYRWKVYTLVIKMENLK
ncbi:MAG: prepilin-type N-terminal cleavage/methylation domain-containing protein [Nitrospirae bacterium]|nr:MAG: prepilin-type N-terminal cleavage/methylation domain-containing protein [Nitrospirota bacterium]